MKNYKLAGFAAIAVAGITACSATNVADVEFIGVLTSHSIPGDRGVEIGLGRQVCDAFRPITNAKNKNQTPTLALILESGLEMKAVLDRLTGQGLSQDQVGHFVADAADAYCPDVKDTLNRMQRNDSA
jgi:hypothetical protein